MKLPITLLRVLPDGILLKDKSPKASSKKRSTPLGQAMLLCFLLPVFAIQIQAQTFEVSTLPFDGVTTGAIAFADVDGDGDADVLITGFNNADQRIAKLYTNDGNGVVIANSQIGKVNQTNSITTNGDASGLGIEMVSSRLEASGNITLNGTSDGDRGVYLQRTQIGSTTTAAIRISGEALSGNERGIYIDEGSDSQLLTATTGHIVLEETGSGSGEGIRVSSSATDLLVSAGSGANNNGNGLEITATSGNTGRGVSLRGTYEARGGNISMITAGYNDGMYLERATIRTIASGNITLSGTSADGDGIETEGSSSNPIDQRSSITAAGGGTVTLNGITTSSASSTFHGGIELQNVLIGSASGDIILNGQSGSGRAVDFREAAVTLTSTSGNISIQGDNIEMAGTGNALTTIGVLTIEPTSASFSTPFALSGISISDTASGLTIGKATNTENITIGEATTIAGPITVYGGDIAINAAFTATNDDINLHASGAVTQSAALTANGLGLHESGIFTLTNTSNNVATIAGGENSNKLGSLSYTDASGGLTIGAVNPTGIYSVGPILIETLEGDISLEQNLSTDDATADAIIINAGKSAAIGTITGGDIKVVGNPSITTGVGGIAKLFSGGEGASTGLTALVSDANTRSPFDETSSITPSLEADNTYAIYRVSSGTGDLTIVASGGDTINTTWSFDNGVISTLTTPVDIDASVVESYLAAGDLRIEAGNITVDANVTSATANALTLKSRGNVIVNPSRSVTTSGGDVILWADSDNNRVGGIRIGSDFDGVFTTAITTNGGDIILSGGSDPLTGYAHYDAALGAAFSEYNYAIGVFGATLDAGGSSDGGTIIIRGSGGNTFNGLLWTVNIGGQYGANTKLVTNGAGTVSIVGDGSEATANATANNSRNSWATVIPGTVETESGNIALIGLANVARLNARGFSISGAIQSASGAISLEDRTPNTASANYTGPFINGAQFGKGSLSASSGNVSLTADKFAFENNAQINTTGTVAISSYGDSFLSPLTFPISNLNVSSTAGGLTLGKSTNNTSITIANTTSIAGPITVYGGDIAINAATTATNDDINLHASGAVTQTAALTANGLGLHGSGTFTLTNTSNIVATIAGGENSNKLGRLSYTDASGGLTIGTVNPTGIYSVGPILIETLEGDITLSQNLLTDDTSSDAIIVNAGKSSAIGTASGGDIKVSGAPTVTTGSGGIAKLFSGSDANSTGLTTLVGGESNTRTEVDETTTSFNPVLEDDKVYALYRKTINTTPTISTISNENGCPNATITANFTINDAETALNNLILSATSSNQSLITNANIVFAGTGDSRTVTINPELNANGLSTITITVTDELGLDALTSFDVLIEDTQAPEVSCITNQSVETDNNVCTYTHSGTAWDATATDNCSATVTYELTGDTTGTGTSLDGVVFNLGETTVTWTATDASNNTDLCSFTVTVEVPSVSFSTRKNINVLIQGECSSATGIYTYETTLNGKNSYVYTVDLDGQNPDAGTAELRLSFDGTKWVLWADSIEDTGFENTNVPEGLLPPTSGWVPTGCPDGTLAVSFSTTENINLVIEGDCSFASGIYTYENILNGKNSYVYTVDLEGQNPDAGTAELRLSFDGTKWVLWSLDIESTGFENTNVPNGLLPPTSGWVPTGCAEGTLAVSFSTSEIVTNINVDIQGNCSLLTGIYTYETTLNGKNSYVYFSPNLENPLEDPEAFRISFDGTKWVLWGYEDIAITGFENTNVPEGLLPPTSGWVPTECADGTLEISFTTFNICEGATIADIAIAGNEIQWYDSETGGAALPTTTLLTIGSTYYVSQTIAGCESPRVVVPLTISPNDIPVFEPVAAICPSASLDPLPTTSTNGITGTWTPALNNTETTTYTFTPEAGQCATTTTLTITVEDSQAPIANTAVLEDIIAQCDITTLIPPTATDACDGTITATTDMLLPITESTTITWIYTDSSGNSSQQTQELVVSDTEAPVANTAVLEDIIAQCNITTLTAPTATDACDGTITATTDMLLPITESTTITWIYTDSSGNSSQQTQELVVSDTEAPQISALNTFILNLVDGQATITADMIDTGSTDNCAIASRTFNRELFNCEDLTAVQPIVLTYTVTDTSGNSSTANMEVTLADSTNFCPTLAVVSPLKPDQWVLYPNPAANLVYLRTQQDVEFTSIKIIDTAGKVLKTFFGSDAFNGMYVGDLPTAHYLLELTTNTNQKVVKKLIVKN